MKKQRIVLASVVTAGLAMVSSLYNNCLAGRYSSSSGYSTSVNRASSPVHGFGSAGQSFTFQPSGGAPFTSTSRGTSGTSIYGPQYRFDAFTRPRVATSAKKAIDNQLYYFGGRMWYPRKF